MLTRVAQLWGRTVSFTEALRSVAEPGGHARIPTQLLLFKCALSFHTVHGVLKARILKWFAIPPSTVDHVLSELSTMTHPPWVAPHSMAYSFIELEKAVIHVISLVSFL